MNRPIGFLDSGVGGLTVVKEAMRQLPNESIIYIGDNARCPYGPRPVEEINAFTQQLVDFLVAKQVKLLVVACNTATAVSLEKIRERLSIPVVGVIHPGARAANRYTRTGKIGILATSATIQSALYQNILLDRNPDLQVFPLVCSKFVPLVESKEYSSPLAKKIVKESLLPLKDKGLDTVILGCTHYPLLRPLIQHAVGDEVTLVNSGAETITDVASLMDFYGLSAHAKDRINKSYEFYTTGGVQLFQEILEDWIGPVSQVQRVSLDQLQKGEY
ncbi:glutamate racemase [Aerococcus christensenii]|nr:glutamate racemase [Aerococcus christensenii]MDK8234074.1 glutamate racemase [Aerococcus christensenii]PKY91653.1 glutamate racemase [Aerococcus christensenii]